MGTLFGDQIGDLEWTHLGTIPGRPQARAIVYHEAIGTPEAEGIQAHAHECAHWNHPFWGPREG